MAIDREARKKRTKRLVCGKLYILMIDVLERDQRVVSWLSSRHLNGMQGLHRFWKTRHHVPLSKNLTPTITAVLYTINCQ